MAIFYCYLINDSISHIKFNPEDQFPFEDRRNLYTCEQVEFNPLSANVAIVASRTRKIIKNDLKVFSKEENICYKNGILHFVFKLSQSSEIKVRI